MTPNPDNRMSGEKNMSSESYKERKNAHCRRWYHKMKADPERAKKFLEARKLQRQKKLDVLNAYDRNRDRVKRAARSYVRWAIRTGKITRLPCEVCGDVKSQAHHDDYTKPLEVRFLCAQHHRDIHNPAKQKHAMP